MHQLDSPTRATAGPPRSAPWLCVCLVSSTVAGLVSHFEHTKTRRSSILFPLYLLSHDDPAAQTALAARSLCNPCGWTCSCTSRASSRTCRTVSTTHTSAPRSAR
ncbi:hypothetical protein B0H14DRAFT_2775576 [Mycena olivaceomarginata]|nr:hypothetical protein B0H14DRAFT_2775576 [Mycena olivaceomarginata]